MSKMTPEKAVETLYFLLQRATLNVAEAAGAELALNTLANLAKSNSSVEGSVTPTEKPQS